MNETRADTGDLVRGDRCANSTTTDGHASFHVSASNGASQWHDIIQIIIVELRVSVSEIDYFITGLTQLLGEELFQFKAAVVGGNANKFPLDWQNKCGVHDFHFRLPVGDRGGRK